MIAGVLRGLREKALPGPWVAGSYNLMWDERTDDRIKVKFEDHPDPDRIEAGGDVVVSAGRGECDYHPDSLKYAAALVSLGPEIEGLWEAVDGTWNLNPVEDDRYWKERGEMVKAICALNAKARELGLIPKVIR